MHSVRLEFYKTTQFKLIYSIYQFMSGFYFNDKFDFEHFPTNDISR